MFLERKLKGEYVFSHLNQAIPILMGIFLFFNPFPHTTAIKEICFYLSLAILLFLLLCRKVDFSFQSPLSVPFGLFVLWSFVGILFALNKPNTIHDFYAHLLKYMAFYYLIINFFSSRKRFHILLWTIIASSAIFAFWIMIYYYVMLGNIFSAKLGLFMDQFAPNIIGIVSLFGVIMALNTFSKGMSARNKYSLFLCLFGTTLATLMTQSRGSIIALFVSLPFLFWSNKKKVIIFILVLFIIIGVTPLKNRLTVKELKDKITGMQDDRIKISYLFIEMAKDYPITGIGFGMQTYYDENMLKKYHDKLPAKFKQSAILAKAPHNSLVDIAVRVGFVGLSFFIFILVTFVHMGWSVIRNGKDDFIKHWGLGLMAAFFAIFTQGMVENTLFGAPAIILYTIFAMITILWRMNSGSLSRSSIPES